MACFQVLKSSILGYAYRLYAVVGKKTKSEKTKKQIEISSEGPVITSGISSYTPWL